MCAPCLIVLNGAALPIWNGFELVVRIVVRVSKSIIAPFLMAASMVVIASPINASVVIESVNKHQMHSKVSIEATRARIDSGSADDYLLMDLASGKTYTVNHLEGVVIDLESAVATSEHITSAIKDRMMPKVELLKQGEGPVVNGFATVHYRVMINDTIHCSDEYLAPAATENEIVKNFVAAMARGSDGVDAIIMASLFGEDQMCEAAADIIDDQYAEKGLPMRSMDSEGMVSHEITHINQHSMLTNEEMTIPAGYELLSRAEMRKRLADRVKPIQDQIDTMPDINMDEVMQQQIDMQLRMKDASKNLRNEMKTGFE